MSKFCEVRPTECSCNGRGCNTENKQTKKNEKQKKRR